jgi:hypothetical protein
MVYLSNYRHDPRKFDPVAYLMGDHAAHLMLLRDAQSKRGQCSNWSNGLKRAFPERPDYHLPELPPLN